MKNYSGHDINAIPKISRANAMTSNPRVASGVNSRNGGVKIRGVALPRTTESLSAACTRLPQLSQTTLRCVAHAEFGPMRRIQPQHPFHPVNLVIQRTQRHPIPPVPTSED